MVEFKPFGRGIGACESPVSAYNDVLFIFALNFPHPSGLYRFWK